MAEDKNLASEASQTILGADAIFKGEMTYEGAMRIEGKFEGKLNSKGRLAIGRNADITGEIDVGRVNVEGAFKGNISARERVEVSSSARVLGDLRAPKLVVAEGATLIGNFNISPEAVKGNAADAHPAAPFTPGLKK
jgi:cytoskeletal protein CcmA (bactofilin family)